MAGYTGAVREVAYAKNTIKLLTIAHDSGLRNTNAYYPPAGARITDNRIATVVLAEYSRYRNAPATSVPSQ